MSARLMIEDGAVARLESHVRLILLALADGAPAVAQRLRDLVDAGEAIEVDCLPTGRAGQFLAVPHLSRPFLEAMAAARTTDGDTHGI